MLTKLIEALRSHMFRFATEAELQEGIAKALTEAGLHYERECSFDAHDRVDFLVEDRIALEIKIDGSLSEITRQLHRYAQHAEVKEIVLATSRRMHDRMPNEMNGKPVLVVVLSTGAF